MRSFMGDIYRMTNGLTGLCVVAASAFSIFYMCRMPGPPTHVSNTCDEWPCAVMNRPLAHSSSKHPVPFHHIVISTTYHHQHLASPHLQDQYCQPSLPLPLLQHPTCRRLCMVVSCTVRFRRRCTWHVRTPLFFEYGSCALSRCIALLISCRARC